MKSRYVYLALLFFFVTTSYTAKAQFISTIAGTGTSGSFGDGLAATVAQLNTPNGLFCDTAGNIFFADFVNQKIRKINASGIISTVAGTGSTGFSGDGTAATAATMNHPSDVAVNKLGHIVFCDYNNNRVRKIVGGIITTIAGNGSATSTGDGLPATAATLNGPAGVCFDTSGNLLIAEHYKIRIINATTGIISTYAGTGTPGSVGDGGPATAAQLNTVNFISADAKNNLFISDNANHRIRKVTGSGIITTIAGNGSAGSGGDGSPATMAQLSYPSGAVADKAGNVYIADALNNKVRKINTAGIISTFAGTGTPAYSGDGGMSTAADINQSQDVAIDASGDLLFGDFNNYRIRKIILPHPPHFAATPHSFNLCKDSSTKSINYLLAAIDSNVNDSEKWSVVTPPAHGTLTGFSTSMVSTGSLLTPSGLSYTSTTGYTGPDSFFVKIVSGLDSDSVRIYVNVVNCKLGIAPDPIAEKGLFVVPNPSNGLFNVMVASEHGHEASLIITNVLGQKVEDMKLPVNINSEVHLDLPAGAYFIFSTTVDGINSCKILIQK